MHLRIEIRTVNHRFFNASVRLPDLLAPLESSVRDALRKHIHRGHVNCTIKVEESAVAGDRSAIRVQIDRGRASEYLEALRDLAREFDLPGEPDLRMLSRFGDVLIREDVEEVGDDIDAEAVMRLVESAAEDAAGMREQEGERLAADLLGRIAAIDSALDEIARRAPERLISERDRLRQAISELMDGARPDPDRIAQEIAYLSEKWDINEEIVRFRSHTDLFRQEVDGSPVPAGKRLGFLVQEMHREANTIGSKANDATIAQHVVSIKEEIERLREQVDNVE